MFARQVCILLVAFVCVASVGCGVQSVHPLSDPAVAKMDDRLLGVWKFQDANEMAQGDTFLHVAPNPQRGAGVLSCLFVQHSDGKELQPRAATMFTTSIGERRFINVRWETENGPGKYAFFKYEQQEEALSLYPPQSPPVVEAVRSGELEGAISNGIFGPRVTLRDTSDNLFKFFTHGDDAVLFGKETRLIFTRIGD